jgi:hypothetical protein
MSTNNKLTPRAKQMFPLIEKFLVSEVTQQRFCQQQDIRLSTFQWWLHQYRKVNKIATRQTKPAAPKFIPIKLEAPAPITIPPQCRIEYPNGIVLHLSGQLNPEFIINIIQATGA